MHFLKKNGYAFEDEFVFEPVLGAALKKALEERRPTAKKKQILVYGRPSVERNAFPLIIEALRVWVTRQDRFHDWQLVSAGEPHPDIALGCGRTLESLGKLSITEYISTLRESAVGISLMVSPHPSYPPMEMAMFGMGVISNTYANKQLSAWHENIHSIDLSVDNLVHALSDRCEKFSQDPACFQDKKLFKKEYMAPERQFYFLKDLVGSLFQAPVRKES
jgi:O-antigen biosynthesis protein